MFEIHYGLSVLLCAAMVVLMIWIAVTWRRRRGSLAARIASISVAIVMLVLFAPPDLFDEIVRSVR